MKPAPAPEFPFAARWVAGLCLLYLLAGIAHDPWKPDDAMHLGVAWSIAGGNGWMVPRIGGLPWLDTVPVYHWVAVVAAKLTGWLLPFHVGARLATPLFGALLLYALYRAAQGAWGRSAALAAPLLAVGTVGLLVPMHDAQPAIAVLAATAAAYYGLYILPQQAVAGTVWLGIGSGSAFMFGGLDGFVPLVPLLLLPAWRRQWVALFFAFYIGLSVASLWPTLMAMRSPELLTAWWVREVAGAMPRFAVSGEHFKLLGWFTWPLLPLAAWTVWRQRREWREWPLLVTLVGTLAALVWFFVRDARPPAAMPLLVPLCLLAAAGAHRLRRGAANAFDWFGAMTLTLAIALIWLGGIAMMTGWPPKIARNFAKLEPGFVASASWFALAVAIAVTAAWGYGLLRLPRSPWRASIRWTVGMVALWTLLIALWLPWVDYGKTYRPVMTSLAKALPSNPGCIEGRNLGWAQRALADYHAGIRTVREGSGCNWLLEQGTARQAAPAADLVKVWEGHRPGDKSERLRLYRRD